ncbi:hypothetical protein AB1N83_011977 [Pleurotus pulmonarius]
MSLTALPPSSRSPVVSYSQYLSPCLKYVLRPYFFPSHGATIQLIHDPTKVVHKSFLPWHFQTAEMRRTS